MGFANVTWDDLPQWPRRQRSSAALWMWEEITQPRSYMARWGMPGWKWLG